MWGWTCPTLVSPEERLGLIASSCVLGCVLFFHRGSSNTSGCRTDLHTSTWSAASQKNFPSYLEAESEGWHLLTFWPNSPLFVGLKIHFHYLDTKTQNMTFFCSHRNRRWGGRDTDNLPKGGILYLNSILIHHDTAGQTVFLPGKAAARLKLTSAIKLAEWENVAQSIWTRKETGEGGKGRKERERR